MDIDALRGRPTGGEGLGLPLVSPAAVPVATAFLVTFGLLAEPGPDQLQGYDEAQKTLDGR